MSHLNVFIKLTRLDKPIGFMLLFWPCAWGLAYSYMFNQNITLFIKYLLLFFLGSVLMRSAGCIVNDIVDKNFDKQVERTKNRPLPSGEITAIKALLYALIICFLAFLILIQFNFLTILLGISSMLLAFSYPFMKRITYWPQLFLGLTFNWGIIMAWSAFFNYISLDIIILYISAIFWTLGYDTIYGAQDMSDDEIIGVKSTSIKFKNYIKVFVGISYITSVFCLIYLFKDFVYLNIFTFFLITFIMSLFYQIKIFDKNKPECCLRAFKINNFSGLLLFLAIFSISV